MFVNFALAFIEGFALIISPCILPILPLVLAGSITGSKKHPLGIIIGFVTAFTLFTLFSKTLVELAGIDLNILRNVSLALLLALGFIMFSGYLTEQFSRLTGRLANLGSNLLFLNRANAGFGSGLVLGALIGLIWTPCAGPILAAVIVQSVIQTTTLNSFFTVFAFGLGAAIPMLLIAFFGRKILDKMNVFKKHAVLLRKLLGAIIIASVVYIIYSNSMTASFFNSAQPDAEIKTENKINYKPAAPLINPVHRPYPAPMLEGISEWLNSDPLTINDLKGKVVLIDFWSYSCINCIRTMPYLNAWYQKYHDQGLEIIGVHSPEFDFERNADNVKNAIQKNQIQYPVALDNRFATWQNYHNSYWPAHYLIDKNGRVVYEKFGEGDYDITENNIRFLLGLQETVPEIVAPTPAVSQTPETYLGYARADSFAQQNKVVADTKNQYHYPKSLAENAWALEGEWVIKNDKIAATAADDKIKINFKAGKVYAVMGKHNGEAISVEIRLDGELKNTIQVTEQTIYTLLELPQSASGVLELTIKQPGLELYTFTFGP